MARASALGWGELREALRILVRHEVALLVGLRLLAHLAFGVLVDRFAWTFGGWVDHPLLPGPEIRFLGAAGLLFFVSVAIDLGLLLWLLPLSAGCWGLEAGFPVRNLASLAHAASLAWLVPFPVLLLVILEGIDRLYLTETTVWAFGRLASLMGAAGKLLGTWILHRRLRAEAGLPWGDRVLLIWPGLGIVGLGFAAGWAVTWGGPVPLEGVVGFPAPFPRYRGVTAAWWIRNLLGSFLLFATHLWFLRVLDARGGDGGSFGAAPPSSAPDPRPGTAGLFPPGG